MIYRLYSRGSALEGQDQLEVLANLTILLRSDINHVKNFLLSGQPYPIKSSASHAQLRAVERRLLAVGLDVFIHEYDPTELIDPVLTQDVTVPLISEADAQADWVVAHYGEAAPEHITNKPMRLSNRFFRWVKQFIRAKPFAYAKGLTHENSRHAA